MFGLKLLSLIFSVIIIEAVAETDLKQLAKANNDVGLALLKTFPPEQNAFFSPVSIYTALGMAYGAARGETAQQMRDALEYEKAGLTNENVHQSFRSLLQLLSEGSDEYRLEIANAILSQIGLDLRPEYKDMLQNMYKALHKEINFAGNSVQAVSEVNNWVKQKTNGKISKLLDELSPRTRMILLNAIYFKGTWKKTFNANSTKDEPFFNNGINEISVPMMKITEVFPYASFSDEGFHALELPYKGEEISMVILLPERRDGLQQLVNEINASKLQSIISELYPIKVNVKLPKFKMEDSKELKENLISLGMKDAFNGRADFSGISGKPDLYISDVLHKAVIEVNEEGSEAAAVTAVIFLLKASFPIDRTPEFNVDRPFLFFIRDRRTDMILFGGRVNRL
uniref:Putative serpin-like protein ase inhibitor n=1 Tax=Tityus obscurus TaxID=1221240 RepID=A0A1E1WWH8_TITOB